MVRGELRRGNEEEEEECRGGAIVEEGAGAAEGEEGSTGGGGVRVTKSDDAESQGEEGQRQKGRGEGRRRKRAGKKGREAKKRKLAGEANARSKEEKVMAMMQLIGELYPEGKWSEEEVRSVVEEAYLTADGNYGEEAAEAWGADFEWPREVRKSTPMLVAACSRMRRRRFPTLLGE